MRQRQIYSFIEESFWPYALLIAAVFLAYADIYPNTLLLDDTLLIAGNKFLRDWHSLGQLLTSNILTGANLNSPFYRPLQMAIYFIIYQLTGPETFGFHFVNLALQCINACLVYLLGRRLGFRPIGVFLAALIWALHPIDTNIITYMSGTADPLCVALCLLGIIILLPDFTPCKFAMSSVIFLLALLSKENAVVFPLLTASCILLVSKNKMRDFRRTGCLWLIDLFYLWARFSLPAILSPHPAAPTKQALEYGLPDFYYNTDYAQNIFTRIFTCLATLPDYIRLLFWPSGLHIERAFPVYAGFWHPQVLFGAVLVCGVIFICVKYRSGRGAALSWGLLWAASAHALGTGIPSGLDYIFAEHWMYLPSIGLFLGIAETLAQMFDHPAMQQFRPAAICAVLVIACLFGAQTYMQNRIWRDPITLYTQVFAHERSTSAAHNMMANAYAQQGDLDHAIEQYRLSLEISDKRPEVYSNLATALFQRKRDATDIDDAAKNARHAIKISTGPNDIRVAKSACLTLAKIYGYKGDLANAKRTHLMCPETEK